MLELEGGPNTLEAVNKSYDADEIKAALMEEEIDAKPDA